MLASRWLLLEWFATGKKGVPHLKEDELSSDYRAHFPRTFLSTPYSFANF
jgi:hypothetical protein